jgi:hypothetical protein
VVKVIKGKKRKVRVCPKPPVSQAAVAKKVVSAFTGAKTPQARRAALLELLRALKIPVQTGSGSALSTWPEEGSARYLQLYDFELRGLADQYARGATTTVTDIAAQLTRVGIDLEGRPFPPELLAESVRDAVRGALQKPQAGRPLLPLVVRNLGLRRGFDVSKGLSPTQKLDTLQGWLVMADVVFGALRNVVPEAARTAAARADDLPTTCEKFNAAVEAYEKKIEAALGGKAQKWIADKAVDKIFDKVKHKLTRAGTRWAIKNLPRWTVRGVYTIGRAAQKVTPWNAVVHGALLAYSTDVRSLEESLAPIHWWHSGTEGTTLVFRIKVTMLDDYGDTLVKCGNLVGMKLPAKGPVPDVWVNWEQAQGDLHTQGTLDCRAFASYVCASKTAADGIARLVFTPKKEILPGVGTKREETGVVNGIALYQSASDGGVTGLVAQLLFPKLGGSRWFVESHRARGFKFDVPVDVCYLECGWGNDLHLRWSARVCGPDPFGVPWEGHVYALSTAYANDPLDADRTWTFSPERATRDDYWPYGPFAGGEPQGYFEIGILPGSVKITTNVFAPYPTTQTVEGVLEEDSSCPAPS